MCNTSMRSNTTFHREKTFCYVKSEHHNTLHTKYVVTLFSIYSNFAMKICTLVHTGNKDNWNLRSGQVNFSLSSVWPYGPHYSSLYFPVFDKTLIFNNTVWFLILKNYPKFRGPTWGPPGTCRPQVGPILAPWALLSGQCTMMLCIRPRSQVPAKHGPVYCNITHGTLW